MVMDVFYKAAGTIWAPFRYAQKEIENTKEDLKADARKAISSAVKISAAVCCTLFFLLFGSIAAAVAVNVSMDSAWSGYAIVAGTYLVLAICIYAWKQASDKKKSYRLVNNHVAKTA